MAKIVIDIADLYETGEAARLIGIGYVTLYRWIKKGKLTPVRVSGRTLIPKFEIDRLKRNRDDELSSDKSSPFGSAS